MVLKGIVGSLLGSPLIIPSIKRHHVKSDDLVDRINHVWTVTLLAIFAVIVTARQFVGSKIECWCPAEFKDPNVDYAKAYCWVRNTYFVPYDKEIPSDIKSREQAEVKYYQWVPLILLLQALLFKLPALIWKQLNGISGIDLQRVLDMAAETQLQEHKDRTRTINNLGFYLYRWLKIYHKALEGTFLMALYISLKVLYTANVIAQFFILNAFLSKDYQLYGYEVVNNFIFDENWRESSVFPRTTLCDMQIRQLQNLHNWTLQCVLPINLFNEKLFIFIWFWFVLVALVTCVNLVTWLYRVIFKWKRMAFITHYLKSDVAKTHQEFAQQCLSNDGIFVMRAISRITNGVVVAELLENMSNLYEENEKGKTRLLNSSAQFNSEKSKIRHRAFPIVPL